MNTWNPKQVCAWLQKHDLGAYSAKFLSEQVSGDVLLELSEHDIEELGVNKIGHKKKLKKLLDVARKQGDNAEPIQTPTSSVMDDESSLGAGMYCS